MKHIQGFIAADHRGFWLKDYLKRKHPLIDLGTFDDVKKVDYPDYAKKLCALVKKEGSKGILICGTGLGMSIAANRYSGIRAALCRDVKDAEMARKHNDANVLVLAGDFIKGAQAEKIAEVFFKTKFSQEQRHKRRIKKMDN
jgi:ribose 5-phosphate isomerase B